MVFEWDGIDGAALLASNPNIKSSSKVRPIPCDAFKWLIDFCGVDGGEDFAKKDGES